MCFDSKPYLIDAYKTEWFQIECTDGKTYVLIKKKSLFDLPRVDAEPVRHARWEKNKDDLYWGNHFIHRHCSLCGGEAHINRFGTAHILSAFCPNCGAKMDGKEDAHG